MEKYLSNNSALLLESNPVHKKIPVLIHSGRPIAESLIILDYIDETWGEEYPLLPKEPYGVAMASFWTKFVEEKPMPTGIKAIEKEAEEALEEFYQQMKLLENELKGKDFFRGETMGYLDIVVFHVNYCSLVLQEVTLEELLTEEKLPVMYKWTRKLLDMDVVRECLPPRDKHVARLIASLDATKSDPK